MEGLDIDVIEPDSDLLDLANPVRVCDTVDLQSQQFAKNEASGLVMGHNNGAPDTKVVQTHLLAHIPRPLAPHVIGRNLSPRAALTTPVPIICGMDLEPSVGPLPDFLLAALTVTNDDDVLATVNESAGTPPGTGAAQAANDRRKKLLFVQLPNLRPATPAQRNPAITGMV